MNFHKTLILFTLVFLCALTAACQPMVMPTVRQATLMEAEQKTGEVSTAELSQILAKAAAGECVAVTIADLDRFKPVNDLYGHAAGDQLLVSISEALVREVGIDGVVARIGGDEFVIVLQNFHATEELIARLTRLTALFTAPFAVLGHEVSVGATLGVATVVDEVLTPSEVLRRADVAGVGWEAEQRDGNLAVVTGRATQCHQLRHPRRQHICTLGMGAHLGA